MVLSEITDIVEVVGQLKESRDRADLSPAEIQAALDAAKALRAESIVRELTAYQRLVDMGAMAQETLDKVKVALMEVLEREVPDSFEAVFVEGTMRERYLSVPRETWRSWTPAQRQHFVHTGEMPEAEDDPEVEETQSETAEDE